MDVLSTVLKTVKLEGTMFYNAEFSAPWSLCSPASYLLARYVSAEARHVIIYHLLTHGQAYANVEGGAASLAFRRRHRRLSSRRFAHHGKRP